MCVRGKEREGECVRVCERVVYRAFDRERKKRKRKRKREERE